MLTARPPMILTSRKWTLPSWAMAMAEKIWATPEGKILTDASGRPLACEECAVECTCPAITVTFAGLIHCTQCIEERLRKDFEFNGSYSFPLGNASHECRRTSTFPGGSHGTRENYFGSGCAGFHETFVIVPRVDVLYQRLTGKIYHVYLTDDDFAKQYTFSWSFTQSSEDKFIGDILLNQNPGCGGAVQGGPFPANGHGGTAIVSLA